MSRQPRLRAGSSGGELGVGRGLKWDGGKRSGVQWGTAARKGFNQRAVLMKFEEPLLEAGRGETCRRDLRPDAPLSSAMSRAGSAGRSAGTRVWQRRARQTAAWAEALLREPRRNGSLLRSRIIKEKRRKSSVLVLHLQERRTPASGAGTTDSSSGPPSSGIAEKSTSWGKESSVP